MALFRLVCSRVAIMLFINVPEEAGLPGKLDPANPTAGKGAPEEGQVGPLHVVHDFAHLWVQGEHCKSTSCWGMERRAACCLKMRERGCTERVYPL